jgi:hypothetical protein
VELVRHPERIADEETEEPSTKPVLVRHPIESKHKKDDAPDLAVGAFVRCDL